MKQLKIENFLEQLSTSAPVPGGGGVAALAGALSASLCSMVAALTNGKKKYAQYQEDIERIATEVVILRDNLENLIQKDAVSFEPLSKAYGIPKENPEREQILEEALKVACSSPADIFKESAKIVPFLEELTIKGSKIALSDVGVAATMCKAAMESAALNVFINTKLMKDREYAANIENEISELINKYIPVCEHVYACVKNELLKK